MKTKAIAIIIFLVVLTSVMTSCGCEHEWIDATCTAPKTCKLCNETEGEAIDHDWLEATCNTPKTCADCKETTGDAAGHKWQDATCYTAKTCKICNETEGEVLGHDWQEATTEAPTTCARCKVTEGTKINTDPRFTTASTKQLYGKWSCEVVLTDEMMDTEGYLDELPVTLIYEFKNNGDLIADVVLEDYFINLGRKALTKAQIEDFLKNGDFTGINVTVPYKKTVMPYLDQLTEVAQKMGAVNTIVRRDGKLIGHNTDPFGFLTMVHSSGLQVAGKKVLVLGVPRLPQLQRLV